jgi:DNA modification methylase
MFLEVNKIINGDCVDVMKTFPENSIDCIVTDPPYGLNFMGKSWDQALPPKQAFIEMCRVLKPGALAFVMSSPRQDLMWRMGQLLEESGFDLGQSFCSWIFASGFPKAMDISLGIDIKFIREEFERVNNRKPTRDEIKELLQQKREVIGKGKGTSLNYQNKINTEQNYRPSDYYEDKDGEFDITQPSSDLAKQWQGWKAVSGLKPALEVIFMVQKPMTEKTIVDNVLRWGTGGINIDACRIPLEGDVWNRSTQHKHDMRSGNYVNRENRKEYVVPPQESNILGRFPANLLVSDDMLNDGKITNSPSGEVNRKPRAGVVFNAESCGFDSTKCIDSGFGDSGSASRYFDLDAWARHHGILQVAKASTGERDSGIEGDVNIPKSKFNLNNGEKDERFDGGKLNPRINIHPTVKPIKLMAYLIELGCPPDGIILDPFVGSGTTCIAGKILGRKYIGIELDKEYSILAQKRVDSASTLTQKIRLIMRVSDNTLRDFFNDP